MSVLGFLSRPTQLPLITATRMGDGPDLTALHGEGFERPWNSAEFEQLLGDRAVLGHSLRFAKATPLGFVMSRMAADEAEILSIVVSKAARGKGHSRALLAHHLSALTQQRIRTLFLEVEAENAPALGLYRAFDFQEVGRRSSYYARNDGRKADALIMRRSL